MTPRELLERLERDGIRLHVEEGQLRYRAPKGVLTPELRRAIGANKEHIVGLLTEDGEGVYVRSELQDGRCLHELFQQQALESPDDLAVEYLDRRLTYHQLNQLAENVAC